MKSDVNCQLFPDPTNRGEPRAESFDRCCGNLRRKSRRHKSIPTFLSLSGSTENRLEVGEEEKSPIEGLKKVMEVPVARDVVIKMDTVVCQ